MVNLVGMLILDQKGHSHDHQRRPVLSSSPGYGTIDPSIEKVQLVDDINFTSGLAARDVVLWFVPA